MNQIHLSPLVDQIQLAIGHISNTCLFQLCVVDYETVAQECSLTLAVEPRFPHRRMCSSVDGQYWYT
jgi:hypothetical protein